MQFNANSEVAYFLLDHCVYIGWPKNWHLFCTP